MTDIISQYYQGIVQQLRSEVDSINSLFQHQGVKGSGNENVLRNLLTKFFPKRYGIGTGVIVDRHGTQSRQCDIIIYDTLLYPSLLSLTGIHFFPVDIVYATIEVKTTLTSSSVKEALINIASVKQLDFIKDKFTLSEVKGDGWGLNIYTPSPPIGFIFGYNSEVQQFETFKQWFTLGNANARTYLPSAVGCLDQGLVVLSDGKALLLNPRPEMLIKGWMIPLQDSQGQFVEFANPETNYSYDGHVYPVKRYSNKYVAIDQSRVLLLFLLIMQEILSVKRINPEIIFRNTYFEDHPINRCYEV